MKVNEIEALLNALATEVIYTDKAFVEDAKVEFGDYKVEPRVTGMRRATAKEYCLGTWVEDHNVHELCIAVVREVIRDMPGNRAKLIWRTTPEYTRKTDFMTNKDIHKVYMRAAWMEEW